MKPAGRDDTILVTMPNKFKNLIWIKRNDFVIVTINATTTSTSIAINTDVSNDKQQPHQQQQQHEIKYILNKQHIKSYTAKGQWPTEFTVTNDRNTDYSSEDLMPNYNSSETLEEVDDDRDDRGDNN